MQTVGRSHLLHSECPTRMLARQARQIVGVPVFGEHRAAGRNEEEMIADGCVPEEQTNLGRAFAVFSDDDLPDRIKRRLILDSRAARAAYDARRSEQSGSPATGAAS